VRMQSEELIESLIVLLDDPLVLTVTVR
jgi:hypothetical protein